MRDDAYSEVLVGRVFVILGAKFAEKAKELNAEIEDWIWETGAALDVASAAVAGKREVSFMPLILSTGGVVNSVESVVESAAAGSADIFRISDGGDAQPADDLMSSVGFITEIDDSADSRELLKDIERVLQ